MPPPQPPDAQLEGEVSELLSTLRATLDQIEQLRDRAAALAADLADVQTEYEQKLGVANAEAGRLELRRFVLLAELADRPAPEPQAAPEATPPPPVLDPPSNRGGSAPVTRGELPATIRKRDLVAHIRYFTDDQAVIERINRVLTDPARDVGDLLELMPWGELWRARAADWETLADQRHRLNGWLGALQERLGYWEHQIRQLENGDWYHLHARKTVSSPAEWLAFLDELAHKQDAENAQLAGEVEELQQRVLQRLATSK